MTSWHELYQMYQEPDDDPPDPNARPHCAAGGALQVPPRELP